MRDAPEETYQSILGWADDLVNHLSHHEPEELGVSDRYRDYLLRQLASVRSFARRSEGGYAHLIPWLRSITERLAGIGIDPPPSPGEPAPEEPAPTEHPTLDEAPDAGMAPNGQVPDAAFEQTILNVVLNPVSVREFAIATERANGSLQYLEHQSELTRRELRNLLVLGQDVPEWLEGQNENH